MATSAHGNRWPPTTPTAPSEAGPWLAWRPRKAPSSQAARSSGGRNQALCLVASAAPRRRPEATAHPAVERRPRDALVLRQKAYVVASTSAVTGRSSAAGWACQKFRGTAKKSAGAIIPPSAPARSKPHSARTAARKAARSQAPRRDPCTSPVRPVDVGEHGAGEPEEPLREPGMLVVRRVAAVGGCRARGKGRAAPPARSGRRSPRPRRRRSRPGRCPPTETWRRRRPARRRPTPGRSFSRRSRQGQELDADAARKGPGGDDLDDHLVPGRGRGGRCRSRRASRPGAPGAASARPISTPSTFTRSETGGSRPEGSPTRAACPRSATPRGTADRRSTTGSTPGPGKRATTQVRGRNPTSRVSRATAEAPWIDAAGSRSASDQSGITGARRSWRVRASWPMRSGPSMTAERAASCAARDPAPPGAPGSDTSQTRRMPGRSSTPSA